MCIYLLITGGGKFFFYYKILILFKKKHVNKKTINKNYILNLVVFKKVLK